MRSGNEVSEITTILRRYFSANTENRANKIKKYISTRRSLRGGNGSRDSRRRHPQSPWTRLTPSAVKSEYVRPIGRWGGKKIIINEKTRSVTHRPYIIKIKLTRAERKKQNVTDHHWPYTYNARVLFVFFFSSGHVCRTPVLMMTINGSRAAVARRIQLSSRTDYRVYARGVRHTVTGRLPRLTYSRPRAPEGLTAVVVLSF